MVSTHGIDPHSSASIERKRWANYEEHASNHIVMIKSPPPTHGYASIQANFFEDAGS